MPPIKGYIQNTMLDWEGKLAAVVFLPGCNFRCGYCHARHLVAPAFSDDAIPLGVVLSSLRKQKGWIDGVVISGGEPTLHDDLPELIDTFRREGLGVKLDTNGSKPEVLSDLLGRRMIDYVAMDVKAPLDHTYCEIAGAAVDLEAIARSIELLISGDIAYEFRTTICPAVLDAEKIAGIGRAVRGARLLYLQNFRPVNCLDPAFEKVAACNPDEMREYCAIAAKYVRRCLVRGDAGSEIIATGPCAGR